MLSGSGPLLAPLVELHGRRLTWLARLSGRSSAGDAASDGLAAEASGASGGAEEAGGGAAGQAHAAELLRLCARCGALRPSPVATHRDPSPPKRLPSAAVVLPRRRASCHLAALVTGVRLFLFLFFFFPFFFCLVSPFAARALIVSAGSSWLDPAAPAPRRLLSAPGTASSPRWRGACTACPPQSRRRPMRTPWRLERPQRARRRRRQAGWARARRGWQGRSWECCRLPSCGCGSACVLGRIQ